MVQITAFDLGIVAAYLISMVWTGVHLMRRVHG